MAIIVIYSSQVLDSADEDGKTPLHFAAGVGSINAVKMLLGKGAKINVQVRVQNEVMKMLSLL